MQEAARQHRLALIVPVYEREQEGVYYNTAAVIAADGSYLGKYRKTHIPHVAPGFWEKFYFRPGNLGYPVFDVGVARIGVYICYDRHFPEGARALGLNGAEIVFNPSATVAGLSEHLWKLEQPAHAAAIGFDFAQLVALEQAQSRHTVRISPFPQRREAGKFFGIGRDNELAANFVRDAMLLAEALHRRGSGDAIARL